MKYLKSWMKWFAWLALAALAGWFLGELFEWGARHPAMLAVGLVALVSAVAAWAEVEL